MQLIVFGFLFLNVIANLVINAMFADPRCKVTERFEKLAIPMVF